MVPRSPQLTVHTPSFDVKSSTGVHEYSLQLEVFDPKANLSRAVTPRWGCHEPPGPRFT